MQIGNKYKAQHTRSVRETAISQHSFHTQKQPNDWRHFGRNLV